MPSQRRPEAPMLPTGSRSPTKGRQPAYESNVPAAGITRQTPEQFGGVGTD